MQFNTIYIELEAKDYPLTQSIQSKFPKANIIYIEKYWEVFNRRSQNIIEQKNNFSKLIIAKKHWNLILPNPEQCTSPLKENYYFSQVLNCPFNCEYCILKWIYQSAYPVIFVNTDDFKQAIQAKDQSSKEQKMFFASYDSDIMQFDHLIWFSEEFIPFFENLSSSLIEIRTKWWWIKELSKYSNIRNTVISYTLTPHSEYESKAPSLNQRIQEIIKLQSYKYRINVVIEPIIHTNNFKADYDSFFTTLRSNIDFSKIENIYFWLFTMPKTFLKGFKTIHPKSKLFFRSFEEHNWLLWYPEEIANYCHNYVLSEALKLKDKEQISFIAPFQRTEP